MEEEEVKLRVRSETFADHYSQARQFFLSQTGVEQNHIVAALTFELSKVETPQIRTRVVSHLLNIDADLARKVADGLRLKEMPKPADAAKPTLQNLEPSPALSILLNGPRSFMGRKMGVLVTDGVDMNIFKALKAATVRLDGHADFLAEPHLGVKAQLTLEQVEVDYFKPIVNRYNIALRGGTLSGTGELEYAPRVKVVHLQKLTVQDVQLEYIHKARTAVAEKRVAKKVVQKAQEVSNQPTLVLRADEIHITKSTFGFENKAADPPYRLFLTDAAFHLTNLSNHLTEGTAVGNLTGKAMGSGEMKVEATFRPETQGPDFALAVRIEQVQMPALNDLWRAYEGIDMAAGLFSFYAELAVHHHKISGYAKPIFQDIQVSDPRTEQQKSVLDKVKEKVIGGLAKVLENTRGEVSTKTDLSGTLDNPQTSTWQIVLGLIQNAFFKAILPVFENEVRRSGR